MKAATTRTLNPLPFHDLEPHRFEDLVRQLAYDLRRWKSLEATGRGGSDDGLDIRATELVVIDDDADDESDVTDSGSVPNVVDERLWIFQCKREKSLTPKRVREVVQESLASLAAPPHGFILAVACDVSKKTRDAFREEMVARGVEEFTIWAKGELEDMLFQPKNDRLLFAYFGLSLQTRRRSLATDLRSQIAKKKQLTTLLGNEGHHGKVVLLRDPSDERYPRKPKDGEPRARWLICRALHVKEPGHLVVLYREHLAALTPDGERWDALLDHDVAATHAEGELRSMNAWNVDDGDRFDRTPHEFWNEYIPETERAELKVYRWVPFERIVAIDPLGDGYFPVPQILVDFDDATGPFGPGESVVLARAGMHGGRVDLRPGKSNRAAIFPKDLPGEHDPAPAQFDHTSNEVLPLSEVTGEKLSTLLAAIHEGRKPTVNAAPEETERIERSRAKVRPFQEWRQNVALPLLSGFVSRLRSAGHTARVVVRSVEAGPHRHQALESIEIRVQLHVGSPHNPSYRPSGHVRVSMSEYTGWKLDACPTREESSSPYATSARPPTEGMSPAQLEAEVMGVLERLKSRKY
ncbi:MAG: hypothetical protein ACHQ9S_11625 [Candidatus Binatia bacterium]